MLVYPWYKEGVLDLKTETITVKSITLGLKAKKILAKSGIKSKLVKLDSSKTENGCSYGIEFKSSEFYNIASLLRTNEIEYSVMKRTENDIP